MSVHGDNTPNTEPNDINNFVVCSFLEGIFHSMLNAHTGYFVFMCMPFLMNGFLYYVSYYMRKDISLLFAPV